MPRAPGHIIRNQKPVTSLGPWICRQKDICPFNRQWASVFLVARLWPGRGPLNLLSWLAFAFHRGNISAVKSAFEVCSSLPRVCARWTWLPFLVSSSATDCWAVCALLPLWQNVLWNFAVRRWTLADYFPLKNRSYLKEYLAQLNMAVWDHHNAIIFPLF